MDTEIGGSQYRLQHGESLAGFIDPGVDSSVKVAEFRYFGVHIRLKVAYSRPDYLPTFSAAKASKLSLLVKHHILAIDEAS